MQAQAAETTAQPWFSRSYISTKLSTRVILTRLRMGSRPLYKDPLTMHCRHCTPRLDAAGLDQWSPPPTRPVPALPPTAVDEGRGPSTHRHYTAPGPTAPSSGRSLPPPPRISLHPSSPTPLHSNITGLTPLALSSAISRLLMALCSKVCRPHGGLPRVAGVTSPSLPPPRDRQPRPAQPSPRTHRPTPLPGSRGRHPAGVGPAPPAQATPTATAPPPSTSPAPCFLGYGVFRVTGVRATW